MAEEIELTEAERQLLEKMKRRKRSTLNNERRIREMCEAIGYRELAAEVIGLNLELVEAWDAIYKFHKANRIGAEEKRARRDAILDSLPPTRLRGRSF
jgi:hypothetical protein